MGRLIIEELREAESTQTSLFTPKQPVQMIEQNRSSGRRPVPERVRQAHCREPSRVVLGVCEGLGQMYQLMGWGCVR